MQDRKILVVGEVYIDQHLDITEDGFSVSRLGGIFHAARSCDALGVEYALAYYAPDYLEKDIEYFGRDVLGAKEVYCLGSVDKSPNVMLVGRSDESGNQLYDNILCKQAVYSDKQSLSDVISKVMPTDVLIFPGRYGNDRILNELSGFEGRVHIDMNYDCEDILELDTIPIHTVFLSTSSIPFKDFFRNDSYDNLIKWFSKKTVSQIVVKENRGGSWLYDFDKRESYEAPAYLAKTFHSVGVGDVYDVAFINEIAGTDTSNNMSCAAWMSSWYAQTLKHEEFRENVKLLSENVGDFVGMDGVRVPWNSRGYYPIYMAAPDFDYVDTEKLDILDSSLRYHNFRPRRPIKENGQATSDISINDELAIFAKDMDLLSECKMMIATLLYNDQGTLVEIGYYQAKGKPVILYDPYKKLNNLFLKNACAYYCNEISQVIEAVFIEMSRMVKNGEKI